MFHRPVCVKCKIEMRPETNGVVVLDYADYGPYELWNADKWKCPICKIEIVVGFGSNAFLRNFESNFKEEIDKYRRQKLLIENLSSLRDKEASMMDKYLK